MSGLRLIALAAALALAAIAAGCGGGGSGGTVSVAESQGTSEACKGTPREGGNLVYARAIETASLNPLVNRNGNGDIFTQEMLFTGLVRLEPGGGSKVVPDLAASWEVSPDAMTYTFHLRPGIKFSDGSPITAEDVRFSLERFGNPDVNTQALILAAGYKDAEVVNPTTVRVHLTEPIAAFLDNISVYPAFIVPKAPLEKEGEAFWNHPVGSGPFMVKDFALGSHITLEKNPYWWEKGKPYLDTVRFNFAPESNSRILALKSGQAQIADGVPYSQIESLQAEPNLEVQLVPVPAWLGISLNHQHPEFADANVRKAIQYALDRAEINEQILRGVGKVPNSILPEFAIDAPASQVKPYEYDLAKAKEYMAKSKFPDGFSTTLQYPSGLEYYKQLTLLIQQELAAIGIKVKLIEQDAATTVERFGASEYEMTFPFPQLSSDVPVPDEFASLYANAGIPPDGTEGFYSHWSDPKIRQMVRKFITTPDETSRAKQWPVIQGEMLDQTPVINVIDVPFINAHESTVCGTDVNALGVDHLEQTWIAAGSKG